MIATARPMPRVVAGDQRPATREPAAAAVGRLAVVGLRREVALATGVLLRLAERLRRVLKGVLVGRTELLAVSGEGDLPGGFRHGRGAQRRCTTDPSSCASEVRPISCMTRSSSSA